MPVNSGYFRLRVPHLDTSVSPAVPHVTNPVVSLLGADGVDVSMPPEIADSDAESEDLIDQVEVEPASDPKDPNPQVSPPKIDFDEFIDPTQRLSDLPPSQDPFLSRGTGSTEKLLRGLDKARKGLASSSSDGNMNHGAGEGLGSLEGSSPLISRKRGQSAIDLGSAHPEEQSTNKMRPKTYSTKSKRANTQSTDLFPDVDLNNEHGSTAATNGMPAHDSTAASMGPPEESIGARERDRPRRVISLLGQSTTEAHHHLSTSTSSVGGYQSINLDFRGSAQGMDVNANPFSVWSQMSADGETASVAMTQVPDRYGNVEQPGTINPAALQNQDIEKDMMTSPERPPDSAILPLDSANSVVTLQGVVEETSHEMGRPSKRRKTDMSNSRATASPAPASARRAASVSTESVSNVSTASSKKRGRKSKASKVAASSPAPMTEAQEQAEPLDDHHAMDPPPSRSKRSRRGTLETSSQVSQDSEPVSNTKRKRKKTKAEESQEQGSPTKNPSSELHLSDEALIGLPKEQYKPRPSRSRSKRSVDDDVPVTESPQVDKQVEDIAAEPEVEAETPKPAKGKGKGTKNKVKRAKTSGVALKKSEPMLSEGEEDILFMDEKPAAVKLNLPPDIGILKKEEKPNNEDEDDDEEVKSGGRAKKNISIEIPAPTTEEQDKTISAAEPKKRGRKPKNRTPSAPTPEPLTDPDDEADKPNANAEARLVLAEKDINATSLPPSSKDKLTYKGKENIAPTPSPTKPPSTTHSSLKSSSTVKSASLYRVGLSKRQSIPSLLRRVDKTKKAPTKVSTTVKEKKVKATDGDGEGVSGDEGDGRARLGLRDKNGELIEWEF